MKDSNIDDVKKSKRSKDKRIDILKIDKNCSCLIYYDKKDIVKSKMYYYPVMGTHKDRKKVDRILSKDYHAWLKMLWNEGYLEEDDSQFYKDLTNFYIAI